MPTPQEFIKSLQGEGVLLVRKDEFYFIPHTVLSGCKMPDPFQKDFDGVSREYFKEEGIPPVPPQDPKSMVFKGILKVLDDAYGLDGVNQAIRLEAAQADAAGKLTSKAGKSLQVLFRYDANKTKIVVDLSKGGRPSNA